MEYRYQCIRFRQTTSDKWLVQFAARAPEIDTWAGVPQKRRFSFDEEPAGETVGFQREESKTRVSSLCEFYQHPENIIQNPLLCSLRDVPGCKVLFVPTPDAAVDSPIQVGELIIDVPDFSQFSIERCIREVRDGIERRVPNLRETQLSSALLQDVKAQAAKVGYIQELDQSTSRESDGDEGNEDTDPTGVLFEESHIVDFWQEVAVRDSVLEEIAQPISGNEFLGYTKEALLSYLKPVVLVDGQHRLRGALEAALGQLNHASVQSEIADRISNGESAEEIEAEIMRRDSRLLPISMLMSTDPEEQVFQFVVVNQKATPIGRALLGTIVSTTLSNDEMENVATRLKNAGIEVEESKAITYLARHPNSPFYKLVERGFTGDSSALLQWNVFASLIRIFRDLRGGKLFGERNDYAEIWRHKFLTDSLIVADYERHGCKHAIEYWSRLDGPWRKVFIAFWTKIRDTFGNTEDPDRRNYWGKPRESNLFNKISLTILAADFFQSLVETRTKLESADEIPELVENWLENVNRGYFDKDWVLGGVKKDSGGIRNQWASIWSDYRKAGGNLPDKRRFRQPKPSGS